MTGRFFFSKGKREELGNRRRTEPQTFGKNSRLEIQGLLLRNSGMCNWRRGRRDGFKSSFLRNVNFRLHLRNTAQLQLGGSYGCAKTWRMLHLKNGRRAVNCEKRIVEKQHGKEETNARAKRRSGSLPSGMICPAHRSSAFTIVKNVGWGQGDVLGMCDVRGKGGEGDRCQGCTGPRVGLGLKIKRGQYPRPESLPDEGSVNSA
jgi:hypothetical protein